MKRTLFIFFFGLSVVFLLSASQAKADYAWFSGTNCSDVGNSKGKCSDANETNCSGTKPTGATCCKCEDITPGCCEKTNKNTGERVSVMSTLASCYGNTDWAYVAWFEGKKLYNGRCQGVTSDFQQFCQWVLFTGWEDDACVKLGFPNVRDLSLCEKIGLGEQPDSGYKCCCRNKDNPFGDNSVPDGNNNNNNNNKGSGGSGSAQATIPTRSTYKTLPNPLGPTTMTLSYLPTLIGKVIDAVLAIIGSIALLMVIYGGFLWMTSAGNDAQVQKGRNTLMWAAIALAIIFLAWMLEAFLFQALGVADY